MAVDVTGILSWIFLCKLKGYSGGGCFFKAVRSSQERGQLHDQYGSHHWEPFSTYFNASSDLSGVGAPIEMNGELECRWSGWQSGWPARGDQIVCETRTNHQLIPYPIDKGNLPALEYPFKIFNCNRRQNRIKSKEAIKGEMAGIQYIVLFWLVFDIYGFFKRPQQQDNQSPSLRQASLCME